MVFKKLFPKKKKTKLTVQARVTTLIKKLEYKTKDYENKAKVSKLKAKKFLKAGNRQASKAMLIRYKQYEQKINQYNTIITKQVRYLNTLEEAKMMNEIVDTGEVVASEMKKSVKEGTIATGCQFVADEERKNWIGHTFGADALEMEGASVAVVCDALDVPFFILRAISDTADMDASFSFDEFMESSAIISAEFVMKMVDKIVE